MEPSHRSFGEAIGAAIIAGDYDTLHSYLAPWLQETFTPAALRTVIEDRLREMMEYAECDELTYPVEADVDGNTSTIEDLRRAPSYRPARDIPAEVTAENFRQWMSVQFLADDSVEIDAWFDMWLAVVEVDGRDAIGYFELEDPD